MNTVQLECFLAVAEVLNFSKVAEMLNITQPAVSHQISSLENELDVKLFTRDSKNVEITNWGIQFLPDALKMVEISKSIKTRLKNEKFPQMKTLEICCHNELEMHLLPNVLRQMQKEFPYLLPIVRFIPSESADNFLENESVHVMFGYKSSSAPIDGLYQELSKFNICCIYASNYATAEFLQKDSLTIKDLSGYILFTNPLKAPSPIRKMQGAILSVQDETDNSTTYFHYCDSYESIMTLVRSGFGITVNIDIPLSHEPDLFYKPVSDLDRISFGLYYKSVKNNPELKRFIELMLQLFQT